VSRLERLEDGMWSFLKRDCLYVLENYFAPLTLLVRAVASLSKTVGRVNFRDVTLEQIRTLSPSRYTLARWGAAVTFSAIVASLATTSWYDFVEKMNLAWATDQSPKAEYLVNGFIRLQGLGRIDVSRVNSVPIYNAYGVQVGLISSLYRNSSGRVYANVIVKLEKGKVRFASNDTEQSSPFWDSPHRSSSVDIDDLQWIQSSGGLLSARLTPQATISIGEGLKQSGTVN
jgi:hypothetical protein